MEDTAQQEEGLELTEDVAHHVSDLVFETVKTSERWKQWNQTPEEGEDPIALSSSYASVNKFASRSDKPKPSAFPINIAPSRSFMEYDNVIEVAMREVRNIKAEARDDFWEEHNVDQVVASLFVLSRQCLECIDTLVTRQQFERKQITSEEILARNADFLLDTENVVDNNPVDEFNREYEEGEQIVANSVPTLNKTVKRLKKVRRVHDDIELDVRQRQRQTKLNHLLYHLPVVHFSQRDIDKEALSSIDASYVDFTSIEEFLASIWQTPSHPFCLAQLQFVEQFNDRFMCNSTNENFKQMTLFIHQFVDAMSEGITKTYQVLDLERWRSELMKSMYDHVMSSLYRSVLPLFLSQYLDKDSVIDRKIFFLGVLRDQPTALGVDARLSIVIENQKSLPLDHENFHMAVQLIADLPLLRTISEKLHHLSEAINIVCHSIESFYIQQIKTSISISADDLLSLFVYLLVAAQTPGLFTQCRFIDSFIMDEMSLGEEGYAVATFDTALGVLASLDEKLLAKNSSKNPNSNNNNKT